MFLFENLKLELFLKLFKSNLVSARTSHQPFFLVFENSSDSCWNRGFFDGGGFVDGGGVGELRAYIC